MAYAGHRRFKALGWFTRRCISIRAETHSIHVSESAVTLVAVISEPLCGGRLEPGHQLSRHSCAVFSPRCPLPDRNGSARSPRPCARPLPAERRPRSAPDCHAAQGHARRSGRSPTRCRPGRCGRCRRPGPPSRSRSAEPPPAHHPCLFLSLAWRWRTSPARSRRIAAATPQGPGVESRPGCRRSGTRAMT